MHLARDAEAALTVESQGSGSMRVQPEFMERVVICSSSCGSGISGRGSQQRQHQQWQHLQRQRQQRQKQQQLRQQRPGIDQLQGQLRQQWQWQQQQQQQQ